MKPSQLPLPLVGTSLAAFYRVTLNPRTPVAAQRKMLEAGAKALPLPSGCVVRTVDLGGRPAERTTVGATNRPRALLYLHGGGYVVGSPATHRSLVAYLARDSGAVAFSLDYRLAPEHRYPAAVDDAVAAFVALSAKGFDPSRIAIGGDSAGGGLAVAAARRLIDEHGMRPGALALLSPWTQPVDDDAAVKRDLVVDGRWGRRCAALYLGDGNPRDPGFAPMFANLAGLPPTLVHVAADESLHDQVLRFVARLREAGVAVELTELPRLWHSGHTQASLLREAADAVHDVGTFLRQRWDHCTISG